MLNKLPTGFYRQRKSDRITCRVEVTNGNLYPEQLQAISKILKTFEYEGERPFAHNSTRQNIILINLSPDSIDYVTQELAKVELRPGSAGPVVRNIVSCLGTYQCPHAIIDTQNLSKILYRKYSDRQLRSKLKISVGGCPNACVNPFTDDIAIIGVAYPIVNNEVCNRFSAKKCGKGLCTVICQEDAITLTEGKPKINYDKCTLDLDCQVKCPEGTIRLGAIGYSVYMGGRQGRRPKIARKITEWIPEGSEEHIVRLVGVAIDMFNENRSSKRLCHVIDSIDGIENFRRDLFRRAEFIPFKKIS